KNRMSWGCKAKNVHSGGRFRLNSCKQRNIRVRWIAQYLTQGIEQLRGASPASGIGHERDSDDLMSWCIGFLGKQIGGEGLTVGERHPEQGPKGGQRRGFVCACNP